MFFPDFVLLHCFILCRTRDSNCSGSLDLIFVSCGSFCSFVLFYIVFALLFSYSERPSAHKIRSILRTLCVPLLLSIKYGSQICTKICYFSQFQYNHSKHVTPVKSVAGQVRISLFFPQQILETNGKIEKKNDKNSMKLHFPGNLLLNTPDTRICFS